MKSLVLRRASRRLTRSTYHTHLWAILIVGTLVAHHIDAQVPRQPIDNEFAEFEEFEDAVPPAEEVVQTPPPTAQPPVQQMDVDEFDDNDGIIEDEEDDFAHLTDPDEFEHFDSLPSKKASGDLKTPDNKAQLKFADIPYHLRNNWSNYQVEMLMIVGLIIYVVNYILGRQTNHSIATQWFEAHQEFLSEHFSLVGDDGSAEDPSQPARAQFVKETDSTISLWCSGRQGVVGMLVQIKLIKRQDLLSVIAQFVRPKTDHVAIRVELEPNEMDSYVTAIGQRKSVSKLAKEMQDLALFTTEKKNAVQYGLPATYTVYSEIAEATNAMLDPKVISMVNKYEHCLEYLHFSDQYSGLKPQEGETLTRQPDTSSVVVVGYNLTSGLLEKELATTKLLMHLVMHCVEKARRFRLSRDGKVKADKDRQAAQETFLKTTHAQRAEAAAARKETKIRERKQKVLEEEDPEKQRRLEKQEQKREAKRKQPRMKQLKVKNG